MALVLIPAPGSVPTAVQDYQRQNALIDKALASVNGDLAKFNGSSLLEGSVVNIKGAIYYNDADMVLSGSGSYVRITASGATATAERVASMAGAVWDPTTGGWYDVSDRLYVFNQFQEGFLTGRDGSQLEAAGAYLRSVAYADFVLGFEGGSHVTRFGDIGAYLRAYLSQVELVSVGDDPTTSMTGPLYSAGQIDHFLFLEVSGSSSSTTIYRAYLTKITRAGVITRLGAYYETTQSTPGFGSGGQMSWLHFGGGRWLFAGYDTGDPGPRFRHLQVTTVNQWSQLAIGSITNEGLVQDTNFNQVKVCKILGDTKFAMITLDSSDSTVWLRASDFEGAAGAFRTVGTRFSLDVLARGIFRIDYNKVAVYIADPTDSRVEFYSFDGSAWSLIGSGSVTNNTSRIPCVIDEKFFILDKIYYIRDDYTIVEVADLPVGFYDFLNEGAINTSGRYVLAPGAQYRLSTPSVL